MCSGANRKVKHSGESERGLCCVERSLDHECGGSERGAGAGGAEGPHPDGSPTPLQRGASLRQLHLLR